MNLTRRVLHDAWVEGEEVANIARSWIRHVDDLRSIEGAFVGGLFRIDAGGGGKHVHFLTHYLFMGQGHFDALLVSVCLVSHALIEARLLHTKLVRQVPLK